MDETCESSNQGQAQAGNNREDRLCGEAKPVSGPVERYGTTLTEILTPAQKSAIMQAMFEAALNMQSQEQIEKRRQLMHKRQPE